MKRQPHIAPIGPEGLKEALDLVRTVFMRLVAPDYSADGVQAFLNFIDHTRMAKKTTNGEVLLWGWYDGDDPAGVIGLAQPCHICLLFVDASHQKRGIARALFEQALARCPAGRPMTVNSSPYALKVYEHLGFSADGPEQTVSGIRFIPMTRKP